MKLTNLHAFEKHLEGASPKHFSDVYLLMSTDGFHRKQGVEKLSKAFSNGQKSSQFNHQVFDAERHSIGAIAQEFDTLGFFSAKRLIVIHNVDAFDKSASAVLEKYLDSPSPAICLALTSKGLHRASSLYKKLEKIGVVVDVAEEKPWEKEKSVVAWLAAEAKAHNKNMSLKAAELMVKRMGTDQTLLQNELHKLLCYIGEKPAVEPADVATICSCAPMENIWQLGEAIFGRDTPTSIRMGRSQLASDTPLIPLLRQIRSQFQTEFQVSTLLRRGATAADITQEFPYMRGTILDRHIKQAQSYGVDRFKEGILNIDKAEMEAKNSSLDPELILDILMVKLTT